MTDSRLARIPWNRVNWPNSLFLVSTLVVALTGVPVYLWGFGLDWFQAVLFLVFFVATGLSITLGYHRLFAHLTFKARWPVRLFALVGGAGAFENSVLCWAAEYRRAAETRREASRERVAELRREFDAARRRLRAAIRDWRAAHRLVEAQLA